MDQLLTARLRELHALAREGILDGAEYAQLKQETLATHRQGLRTQQGLLQGLLVRQAAFTQVTQSVEAL